MSERVVVKGNIGNGINGEPLTGIDFSIDESWPQSNKFNYKMPATTASQVISLEGVATMKLLFIKAEKELTVEIGAQTATTCRGVFLAQVSAATLALVNSSSWVGGQNVSIHAYGV